MNFPNWKYPVQWLAYGFGTGLVSPDASASQRISQSSFHFRDYRGWQKEAK